MASEAEKLESKEQVKVESEEKETPRETDDTAAEEQKSEAYKVSLPLARVKRIIKQDDEIATVSTSSVYAIAAATVGLNI